ncbi:NMDA receptor-regulated gene protein 2, C-terminal domain-containing protein [Strongyloides ratti]|uniref:NMDA receptor-regulated gene protein 2, C-terminal domain-containing protein n=1 Tax=Strongyloides ratti TaxID=34506 RepID=A0A090MW60_STRRB|nr:NMDA receptor-regulated gene protein 2, C-terminal domain-containing protein [Strongyloides ratti]CEF63468.1 NMDA receptor-regulated gene protein 2, C-terminal domain-containing protein [Strongyloides ratti]
MDSDGELQICEQTDNNGSQIEQSYCINNVTEKDQILKECHPPSDCLKTLTQSNNINDIIMKDEISSKTPNINVNNRKRNAQGIQKKIITPLMKNALKQSKKEVLLLDKNTQKTEKNNLNLPTINDSDVTKKEETKSSKIRSAICIDISEAPPVKIPRKPKPSNSLLNKISNVKLTSSRATTSATPTVSNTTEKTTNPETVDRQPSNLIISRLKKQFNCSKEEAVRKYVEKFQSNEMPWIPNFVFPGKNHFTNLSDADHKRYVAIIMNLIQQNPEFRFTHNVTELKDFDNRLVPERALFHKISFEAIDSRKKCCYQFRLPYWKRMMYMCAEARSKDIKNFNRTEYETIDNYECDSTIEPLPLSLLTIAKENHGEGPIIILPDLRKKCVFDSKIVNDKKVFHNANSILNDKNVEVISSNYNTKVVMDVSTFSRLLIGKWGCDNLEYAFPVTVTKEFINGSLENVVTICKKIPAGSTSTRTLAHRMMKYVVRGGVDKNYFDVPQEVSNTSENNLEVSDFAPSSPTIPTSPKNEDNNINQSSGENMSEQKMNGNINSSRGKVYHVLNLNARTSDPFFNILIRSNCAERDCFGNKMSVSHHIEYFPEVGAENLFPEEIVQNYIKCFFRDASHSVIFRIHNSTCNVLQKEFIDLNRLQTRVHNECLNIWKSGLQKVRNILMKLMTVSGGEYLLQEDGNSYKLYSEADTFEGDTEETQNYFRNALKETNEEDRLIRCRELNSSEIFNGISYHVPLMWNFVLSRIPGSLPKRKSANQTKFHNNKEKHKKNH